jgi:F-type H+-transporting ATPase subunit epsilon
MRFEILTPEKKLFEGEVTIATFPGTDGSFQIMDHHAPLVSLLKTGVVEYKFRDESKQEVVERITITGGVVEVLVNKVVLLADGLKG